MLTKEQARMRVILRVLLLFGMLLLTPSAQSQRSSPRSEFRPDRSSPRSHHKGEYTFARLIYGSNGYRRMWTTDYPKADEQFIMGLRNWVRSGLVISDDPIA